MRLLIVIVSLFIFKCYAEVDLRASDICYGDLGCFTTRYPFSGTLQRPIALLPESPEKVSPRFCLYTRGNPSTHVYIDHTELNPLFDPTRETKIIIHGFLDNGFNKHNIETKDALLGAGDYNVIIVDWSRGNHFPYTQATANTQMVGAITARLVNTYAKNYGLDVGRVHIIGHSLGSHTAGYAGERIPGLGRITGLDPAGPYFENTDKTVRLDDTDAKFVDIIHTDGSPNLLAGLGLMQRLGHVDFYVNGGKDQPKCPQTSGKLLSTLFSLVTVDLDLLLDVAICSHMTAVYVFRDSIVNKDCKYTAYPCKSYDDFKAGSCLSCSVFGCNQMGLYASQSKELGMLYVDTQDMDKYPYCEQFYQVKLNSNQLQGQTQARGVFTIAINGDKGISTKLVLDDSDETFKSGATSVRFIPSASNIGDNINSATVYYTKTSSLLTSWMYQDQWSFKNIEILHANSQNSVRLCPEQTYVVSGSSVTFKKC